MELICAKVELTDKETHEYLFRAWYEPLCKYAYSILKDQFEAEDAVQKVFLRLWDDRHNTSITTSVKSYLYMAVHNICLNRVKQLKIQQKHNQQFAIEGQIVHNEVYEGIVEKELNYKIKLAIGQLPPKCRAVFELSRFEMMSYKEIAQQLEISPNTVENQIAKALKLLRENLREFISVIVLYYLIRLIELW
ncbi:RNA polymerase sigma-70 factor (ECF subfamily) [Dysgonomonas hofstadii]|uniref:RNA polymerase sigma-70 factor (ECF subfamily) n=1 Tax=Dysgonomonas hofstadii TaxID=637886 RepID=A0A840CW93_9BACT|nr:RNA polymerase sigma-70 factor [Dysgonomonas hofstadii]MBB4036742.1 RNA polymerase sigma-70 factor (ECF subfamily) [Dysgonomonas hofstadii]